MCKLENAQGVKELALCCRPKDAKDIGPFMPDPVGKCFADAASPASPDSVPASGPVSPGGDGAGRDDKRAVITTPK